MKEAINFSENLPSRGEVRRTRGMREIAGRTLAALTITMSVGTAVQNAEAAPPVRTVSCGPSTPAKKLPILSKGAKGSCVSYYQSLLARHGFLDPSQADGVFGDATAGRTIGFQIQNNIRGTDGTLGTANAGPLTWRAARKPTSYHGLPKICQSIVRGACASKNLGNVRLIKNGHVVRTFSAGFGAETPDTRSDEGIFQVTRQVEHDHSAQFNNAPMDYATYYHGGEAIHAGEVSIASHGCIHASETDAHRAYKFLQRGDSVVVY